MIFPGLLILVGSLVAELVLPWWSMAVVAFAVGFIMRPTGWRAWAAGFWGVAALWLAAAGTIHFKSGGVLTARVAEMLGLPSAGLVLLLTAVLGGVVAGTATLAGVQVGGLLSRRVGQPSSSLPRRAEESPHGG